MSRKKENFSDFLKSEEVQNYVKGLKKGQNAYLKALKRFCEFLDRTPKEIIELRKKDERGLKEQLHLWGRQLQSDGISNSTIIQYLGSKLGRFFKRNLLPITWFDEDWKTYPIAAKDKNIYWKDTKVKDYKKLLKCVIDNCKNLRDKAIIIGKFSSGMDDVDLFQITVQHWKINYDEDTNTNLVQYNRAKTGVSGVAFFSSEACTLINQYIEMENRQDNELIFYTMKRNDLEKDVKPLTPNRFSHALRELTEPLQIEGLTPKTLRRLCETQLIEAELYKDHRLVWLNRTGRQSDAYNLFKHSVEKFREKCLEVENWVTIGNPVVNGKIAEEVEALKQENKEIKEQLEHVLKMVQDLKKEKDAP